MSLRELDDSQDRTMDVLRRLRYRRSVLMEPITAGKEKGLQTVDLQAFRIVVALQGSATKTPSRVEKHI